MYRAAVYILTFMLVVSTCNPLTFTAQKMKFSIMDFLSKCDQIPRKLQIWQHWLKKSLMRNFIFCAIIPAKSRKNICANFQKNLVLTERLKDTAIYIRLCLSFQPIPQPYSNMNLPRCCQLRIFCFPSKEVCCVNKYSTKCQQFHIKSLPTSTQMVWYLTNTK